MSADREGVPYQVDGEAAGFLPVQVELLPRHVRVLAPRGFCPVRRAVRER